MLKIKSITDYLILSFIICFIVISFFIVGDYGPVTDSQKNFQEGKINLTYLLSGQLVNKELVWSQMHGSLSFLLAEVFKQILSDQLNVMDPISARHIMLPILSALFLLLLYFFVRNHWGSITAVTTIACFITYPSFFGHTFNNIKDVPLLVFFSLAIIFFVEWKLSKNPEYLYLFFVFLGLACSIKLYALMVPIILLIWLKMSSFDIKSESVQSITTKTFPHFKIGLFIAIIIVLLFYMPAFWGIENKLEFLKHFFNMQKWILYREERTTLILAPFYQVFYRTPLCMLFFFISGLVVSFFKYRKQPLIMLLVIWVLFPILLHCLPHITYYNGIRQFIVFLVPFSILSVLGIGYVSEIISREFKLNKTTLTYIFLFLVFLSNLWGVITTHPYQTTFFNEIAGGLGGAYKKRLPVDHWDYYLNSYRQAGRWLDAHARSDSIVHYVFWAGTPARFHTEILSYSIQRKDITTKHLLTLKNKYIPHNSYVIFVPLGIVMHERQFLSEAWGFRTVHQALSQGGEIFTIYYKP